MGLLTPDEIRNVAFRKPPLGKRGYDEEDVDTFLDEVERTITELYDEIAKLRTAGRSASPAPAAWSATATPTPTAAPARSPAPSAAADGAVHAELAQIRATLARIEAALGRSGTTNPMF